MSGGVPASFLYKQGSSSPPGRYSDVIMLVACIFLLVAYTAAQRAGPPVYAAENQVPIISYVNENNYDGSYKYSYETGNGISVQEEGFLKNPGAADEAQTAKGSYTYTAPDGQVITVTWYADETGYHANGGLAGKGAAVPRRPPPVGK